MKITAVILMGAVLFGTQSAVAHGYRQVINHNSYRSWSSPPANSFRFHYSVQGTNQNKNSVYGIQSQRSNPQWNRLLYTPMKTSWENDVARQNKPPLSKWQNQMYKHKFRNAKSKPQYPKTAQLSPGGYMSPKLKSSSRANAAAQREWPSYIPPITMIKLPRDTPPDP